MANENQYLTITLTGRPPVKIKKEDWPIVASAGEEWHDGQVEAQANTRQSWTLKVRLNKNRAIVYGVYSYQSQWQQDSSLRDVRGGELIEEGDATVGMIPAAIARVGAALAARLDEPSHGCIDTRDVFTQLVHECTADLPAVEME
jgi:hypothetical protein